MIKGLNKFREHFAGFADCYVLIGGAVATDPDLSLKPFGLAGLGVRDVVNTLRQIYGLPEHTGEKG